MPKAPEDVPKAAPVRRGPPITFRASSAPISIDPKKAATAEIAPEDDLSTEDEEAAETEVVQGAQPGTTRAVARPVEQLPVSRDAVLNNALVKEIMNPSPDSEPEDLSLPVMREIVRAALEGKDLGEMEERIKQLSTMIHDKHALLQAIINGPHALHEKYEWLAVRTRTDRELRKMARRGDLSSSELLVVAALASERIQEIDKEIRGAPPADPITVVHRIENNRKRDDASMAKVLEGTTPQGREIVRKQVYRIRKQVQEHREKAAKETGS